MRVAVSLLSALALAAPTTASAQISDSTIAIVPRVVPAPACLRDSSEYVGSSMKGYVPPQLRNLVVPEFRGRYSRGGRLSVRSHVTSGGVVDSVVITGSGDRTYFDAVRTAALKARYRPARRDGCLVAAWTDSMVMTFPARR